MTHDTETPNPYQSPLTLPDDLTAETLTNLTSATLSPTHPAADLKRMNDKLLVLLHEEGDQSRILLRQSAVLNSLFHLMLKHGLADLDNNGNGDTAPDHTNISLALRTQRQCSETIKDVQSMSYMQAIMAQMTDSPLPTHLTQYTSKPTPSPNTPLTSPSHYVNNISPHTPHENPDKQTEELD